MGKLGLGTVQFGTQYGSFVQSDQVPIEDVNSIARLALKSGIDIIDTAASYGDAENVVGAAFREPFRIVTKIPPKPEHIGPDRARAWVRNVVERSLSRLKRSSVYALLLHRSQDLQGKAGLEIAKELMNQQELGHSKRIGISIYDPAELTDCLEFFSPSLIQCPYNFFDRRIEESGWADRLQANGCKIHVRSAFLQGVLLQSSHKRSMALATFEPWLRAFDHEAAAYSGNRIAAALRGPLSAAWCDAVIVGVTNAKQLAEIAETTSLGLGGFRTKAEQPVPEILIDPSRWSSEVVV